MTIKKNKGNRHAKMKISKSFVYQGIPHFVIPKDVKEIVVYRGDSIYRFSIL